MSKKKVTAPTTYNPGSGHPKEYLAYLNWQEMQALQRLNGNGPRRGPKGIPSFADDSASSMGNERPPEDSYDGYQGGGDGGFDGNSYNDVGSESGGGSDYGGSDYGGSDYGGVGGIQSSASDPSTAAPTSVAGGQNPVDAAVQQEAAYKDAVVASRQQALSQDIANGGISAINVGPMNVPVKIGGGQIAGTISDIAQQTYTPPTTGSVPSGFMSPEQQMIDRQNTMYSPKALSELYKGIGAFGVDDPARRSKIQESLLGQTIELSKTGKTLSYKAAPNVKYSGSLDPFQSDVVAHWTGSAKTKVPALGVGKGYGYGIVVDPSGNVSYTKQFTPEGKFPQTWHTAGFNTGRIGIANIGIDPNQAQIEAASALGREWFNPEANVTSHGYLAGDIASQRRAAGQQFSPRPPAEGKALASAFSEGLESPSISIDSQFAGISPTQPPSLSSFGTSRFADASPSSTVSPAAAESEIAAVEDVYRNGIYPSGSIVGTGQFGYPTKPDGTPVTAEDLAAMPEDVQREYMDKMRFARMTDEKYPLTTDQKIKVAAVTGITAPVTGNIFAKVGTTVIGGISGLLGKIPGQFGDAFSEVQRGMRTLAKPGQAVAAYERLDPLKQQQLATGYGAPSESPSTGYAGLGGIPTQELGGKNYEYETAYYEPYQGYQTQPVERRRRRLSQYERWDRGIGIPSPGDPNYNEYQDYLAEGGSDRYA